jgi:hypothetical protein
MVNKDKCLFLHNIRLNAFRKLAEQLNGLNADIKTINLNLIIFKLFSFILCKFIYINKYLDNIL